MEKKRNAVDLHMHSNASDGLYTPSQLVELSASYGLTAIALTDHDTIDGVEEAVQAGMAAGIEVVPGIELSTYEGEQEYHIIGYHVAFSSGLDRVLKGLRLERCRRMEKIVRLLNGLGLKVSFEDVRKAAAPAAPGRLHLARLMVRKGYVRNIKEAFAYYLQKGRPAFVARAALTPERALFLLREEGAVAVLAHPGKDGSAVLARLAEIGLQGVEVFHPDHSRALRGYYFGIARKSGLLVTGGSDFHGDLKNDRHPGHQGIPYRYLERLKDAMGIRYKGI